MFQGIFQPEHLLVALVAALLVFGPKKLSELGRDLGEAIAGFRNGPRGGPPTHPIPVTGPVEKEGVKKPSEANDESRE